MGINDNKNIINLNCFVKEYSKYGDNFNKLDIKRGSAFIISIPNERDFWIGVCLGEKDKKKIIMKLPIQSQ